MVNLLIQSPQLVFSAISLVTCSVLTFLLIPRINKRGGFSFALLSLSIAIWQLGKLVRNTALAFNLDWSTHFWSSLSFAGVTFIYVFFFRLACRISFRDKSLYFWFSVLAFASALLFISFEIQGKLSAGDIGTKYGYFRTPTPLYHLYMVNYFFFMLFAGFILNPYTYKKIPEIKKKTTTIFYGFVVGFSLASLEFLGIYGMPVYPIADLSPIFFCLILYWAIYRYNIMESGDVIKTLLLRTTYFLILLGIVSMVYVATLWTIKALLHFPYGPWFFVIIISFLLFILTPFFISASKFFQHKFFPVRYSYQKLIAELSGDLSRLNSAEKMFQSFIATMEREYGYSNGRAILFEYHENSFDRSRFICIGPKITIPPNFFCNRNFDQILSRRHIIESLRLGGDNSKEHFNNAMNLRPLNRLEADLVMPLNAHQELIGLLAFSEKTYRPESWDKAAGLLKNLTGLLCNHYYQLLLLKQIHEEEHLAKVGMMSAALAHEIKNPLEGIYGAAQLLKESSEHNPKFIEMILKDSIRLNEVVRRFLDFSRPFSIQLESLDIYNWILQFVQAQNDIKNEPSFILSGSLAEPNILSDPDALNQILLNLTQNAKRYQPESLPIKIQIKENKKRIWISVKDDGEGIPAQHQHKLFSPFFTTSVNGTGLGLANSRKIARALGGNLYFEPGEPGCKFVLQLPKKNDLKKEIPSS